MFRILLLLIFVIEISASRRRCLNGGILFHEQALSSPIVVYGESTAKDVYLDTNKELLFNVTFRVDCILKGLDIDNEIIIIDAGIKSGRMACQWLEPGQIYVVFLEKWGDNANTYRPFDFQERTVDNTTYELLEKTCHLTHIPPLHSTMNNCPNVSMTKFCPHDEIDVSILPKGKYSEPVNTNVRSSYFGNGNQFQLQSNVTIPQRGYIETQTSDHLHSYACLSAMNCILMITTAIVMIMIV